MKVAGYSQHNLSRQSFGMVVSFRDVTQATRDLPNYARLDSAIDKLNLNKEARKLHFNLGILRYVRESTRPRGFWSFKSGDEIFDVWHLLSADGIKSRPIAIPREKPRSRKIVKQLLKAGREVENLHGLSVTEGRSSWPKSMARV